MSLVVIFILCRHYVEQATTCAISIHQWEQIPLFLLSFLDDAEGMGCVGLRLSHLSGIFRLSESTIPPMVHAQRTDSRS